MLCILYISVMYVLHDLATFFSFLHCHELTFPFDLNEEFAGNIVS